LLDVHLYQSSKTGWPSEFENNFSLFDYLAQSTEAIAEAYGKVCKEQKQGDTEVITTSVKTTGSETK